MICSLVDRYDTNEPLFSFRGAVGIALALSLQSEVWEATLPFSVQEKHVSREPAEKVFGFVGGIALLTLIINAPTSGPLLKKLGLVTPTETRLQMVDNFKKHMTHFCLTEYLAMLAEARFEDLDYMVVSPFSVESYIYPLLLL